jgi:D-arabinose 1-dehydrogenase-like Zn-dependent alcohol dehydrogenase
MGSKADFEEMNRYIEEKKIHFDLLLTSSQFSFANAIDAYNRLESGKFHGKIVIKVSEQ